MDTPSTKSPLASYFPLLQIVWACPGRVISYKLRTPSSAVAWPGPASYFHNFQDTIAQPVLRPAPPSARQQPALQRGQTLTISSFITSHIFTLASQHTSGQRAQDTTLTTNGTLKTPIYKDCQMRKAFQHYTIICFITCYVSIT